MPRKYASRMAQVWPDKVTIDIVKFDGSAGVDNDEPIYSELTATFAEDTIKPETDPFENVAARPVYVFNVQPKDGVLPDIKESYRVVFNGANLSIISVNSSHGHLQEIQVITETGRI